MLSLHRPAFRLRHCTCLAVVAQILAITGCGATPAGPSDPSTTSATTMPASTSASGTSLTTAAPLLPVVEIASGNGPILLAAGPQEIWLELHREDRVARIDPQTNEQTEVTDIPVHCGLAASGDAAWATHFRSGTVTRFDAVNGEVLDEWHIDGDPCVIAAEDDKAWVTIPSTGDLVELTPEETEPTGIIAVAPMTFGIATTPDSIWISGEEGGGTVYRIDRASHEVTTVGVFSGADFIAYFFEAIWVSSRLRGGLWKLDPEDGTVLAEALLRAPSGITADETSLWITQYRGSLLEIDPETATVIAEYALNHEFLSPPIIAHGSLWTSALEDNLVLRVDIGR